MEIMFAANFPDSHLSSDKLETLTVVNGKVEGVDFRLPILGERPDNVPDGIMEF